MPPKAKAKQAARRVRVRSSRAASSDAAAPMTPLEANDILRASGRTHDDIDRMMRFIWFREHPGQQPTPEEFQQICVQVATMFRDDRTRFDTTLQTALYTRSESSSDEEETDEEETNPDLLGLGRQWCEDTAWAVWSNLPEEMRQQLQPHVNWCIDEEDVRERQAVLAIVCKIDHFLHAPYGESPHYPVPVAAPPAAAPRQAFAAWSGIGHRLGDE